MSDEDLGVVAEENVWLSQNMMGALYDVDVRTINYHLKKIFSDNELQEDSVIRKFRITAADGKVYETQHYQLAAIIAVGYKVNSERAVQFRKWATTIIQEYTIKGFAMDDERLKNDGSILGKKYFEEQLERIREIRLSERKFYQKITDIYATSIDYDVTAVSSHSRPSICQRFRSGHRTSSTPDRSVNQLLPTQQVLNTSFHTNCGT
jgi:hypothetical protein